MIEPFDSHAHQSNDLKKGPESRPDGYDILIVEDDPDDAVLLIEELRRAGLELGRHRRVDDPESFRSALDERSWHLVLSDHRLPHFSPEQALRILSELDLDTPVIVISGVVSEEVASEIMDLGASDFLRKDDLARLVPAIRREIRVADNRRLARRSERDRLRTRRHLTMLHDVDRAILQPGSTDETITSVLELLARFLESDRTLFVRIDPMVVSRSTIVADIERGSEGEFVRRTPSSEPFDVSDLMALLDKKRSARLSEPISSLPILATFLHGEESNQEAEITTVRGDDRLLGFLLSIGEIGDEIGEDRRMILLDVANQLGLAIERHLLQRRIERHAADLEQRVADRTRELEQANKELETFTHSISHDLREPLRTIRSFVELLADDLDRGRDDDIEHYVERIKKASRKMDLLVRDLIAYSQIRSIALQIWPVDLQASVERLTRQKADAIVRTGAAVEVIRPLPRVTADQNLVDTVLGALLDNGLLYAGMGRSPKITIRAETTPEAIRLRVDDDGPGIDPKYHERIFEIFERLETNESSEGNGIGLALVQKAMEQMGGSCGVDSDGSTGSSFWVEWPKRVGHADR